MINHIKTSDYKLKYMKNLLMQYILERGEHIPWYKCHWCRGFLSTKQLGHRTYECIFPPECDASINFVQFIISWCFYFRLRSDFDVHFSLQDLSVIDTPDLKLYFWRKNSCQSIVPALLPLRTVSFLTGRNKMDTMIWITNFLKHQWSNKKTKHGNNRILIFSKISWGNTKVITASEMYVREVWVIKL